MRFSVDPWDPSFGAANEIQGLDPTSATVELEIEAPVSEWTPRRPEAKAKAGVVLFVDGVRRVEARVWIDDGSGAVHPGICATYAAGVVRCAAVREEPLGQESRIATVGPVLVERGTFTTYGAAEPVDTRAGRFEVRVSSDPSFEGLSIALQQRMAEVEIRAAEQACEQTDADLVVVDGPLKSRGHPKHAIGYVKTHHVAYLPPELHAVVGRMSPGERSPIVCLGGAWSRLSWYLRLPSDSSSPHLPAGAPSPTPWSGVVRCECSADLAPAEAIALADRVSATLPRFASQAHKDGRAPQNLYPIAGLERELRRRLGDPKVIYRAIRIAAARQDPLSA